MTVYVDDMHRFAIGRFRGMRMSHMVADTRSELLAMADAIGVARRWIQHPRDPMRCHFDVSMSKRALAVAHGAVEVGMRELAQHRTDVNA